MSQIDPMSKLAWGFEYRYEYEFNGVIVDLGPPVRNLIPQAGIDHLAGLLRGTVTPINNWYLGLYEGNYVANNPAVVSADLPVTVGECIAYNGATRLPWTHVYDGVSAVDNVAARAEFTFTTAKRIYGGFLSSASAKGAPTGLLMSIARFSTPRDVEPGGILRLLAGVVFVPTTYT